MSGRDWKKEIFDPSEGQGPAGNREFAASVWDEIRAGSMANRASGQNGIEAVARASGGISESAVDIARFANPNLSIVDRLQTAQLAENGSETRTGSEQSARADSRHAELRVGGNASEADRQQLERQQLEQQERERDAKSLRNKDGESGSGSSIESDSWSLVSSDKSRSVASESHSILQGREQSLLIQELVNNTGENNRLSRDLSLETDRNLLNTNLMHSRGDDLALAETENMRPNGKSLELEAGAAHGSKDEVALAESDRSPSPIGKNGVEETSAQITKADGIFNSNVGELVKGFRDLIQKPGNAEHFDDSRYSEFLYPRPARLSERIQVVQSDFGLEHQEKRAERLLKKMLSMLQAAARNEANLQLAQKEIRAAKTKGELSEKQLLPEQKKNDKSDRNAKRSKSKEWANQLRMEALKAIPSDCEKQLFLQQIDDFEKRASTNKLSSTEIKETFKHLSKLLSSKVAAVELEDRVLATRTFMQLLLDPGTCNQGHHNTCNVTTLVQRNVRRHPAKMAEILKTATLTGAWIAPDGKKITLAPVSLVPGGEENSLQQGLSCERTFATQILNVVLINDISQRRSTPEFYIQQKPQSLDDSGERLVYADGSAVDKEPPAIHVEEMDDMQNRLTNESEFVIYNAYFKSPSERLVPVGSALELAQVLIDMQNKDRLPAIIYVDTRNREFGGDGKIGDGKPRAHVVTITHYDAASAQVSVSNQWGAAWNRNYSLEALYRSTLPVEC